MDATNYVRRNSSVRAIQWRGSIQEIGDIHAAFPYIQTERISYNAVAGYLWIVAAQNAVPRKMEPGDFVFEIENEGYTRIMSEDEFISTFVRV